MSKLDRFLVLVESFNLFPQLAADVSERRQSNHNPILLHYVKNDYGPVPFHFFIRGVWWMVFKVL